MKAIYYRMYRDVTDINLSLHARYSDFRLNVVFLNICMYIDYFGAVERILPGVGMPETVRSY